MGKFIDLTGKKFYRLTVIKRSFPNSKWNRSMWLCKCDCGTEKIINGAYLTIGHTKSCGCLKLDRAKSGAIRRLPYGLSSMRQKIVSYKKIAKIRGHEYKLTDEQFKKITQQDCHYCGAKPSNVNHPEWGNGEYTYSGMDRVDNNKGYTEDNVVPCCKICNMAKNNLTLKEFQDWIKRVYSKI